MRLTRSVMLVQLASILPAAKQSASVFKLAVFPLQTNLLCVNWTSLKVSFLVLKSLSNMF